MDVIPIRPIGLVRPVRRPHLFLFVERGDGNRLLGPAKNNKSLDAVGQREIGSDAAELVSAKSNSLMADPSAMSESKQRKIGKALN